MSSIAVAQIGGGICCRPPGGCQLKKRIFIIITKVSLRPMRVTIPIAIGSTAELLNYQAND